MSDGPQTSIETTPIKFKKINETDSQYANVIEKQKQFNAPSRSIFGSASVRMFERAKQDPDSLVVAKTIIDNDRKILWTRSSDPHYLPHITTMAENVYKDKVFLDRVRFDASIGEDYAKKILKGEFNWDAIPDEVLVMMFKNHGQNIGKKLDELETSANANKNQINQRLADFLSTQGQDSEVVQKKLEELKVTFTDPMAYGMDGEAGYKTGASGIMISADASDWEYEYTHEALHYLSGRTALLRNENWVDYQRTGLAIEDRFNWLNEAITESLARSAMQRESRGGVAYSREIKLLDLLANKGISPIDRSLFVKAYFENYDADKPYRERNPQWKTLNTAINSAYSPGFLTKLDKYINEHGEDAASKQLEEDWKIIDQQYPEQKVGVKQSDIVKL